MPQIKTTFGFHSTAEEVVNGIDLSEIRVIATGGSSGIGIETARTLALIGAEVTLAVRNVEAGNIVAANIKETTSNPKVAVAHLDLADLASVREFVGSWRGPLHILINNAGIMALPELVRTREGYEMQFATNFLGHFALTVGLHRFLATANGARVVSLSSSANMIAPVIFDDLHFNFLPYEPFVAYGQSKTANVLFAVEATRRWMDDGIFVNAVNPGAIATKLQKHTGGLKTPPERRKTIQQGAATSVLVAVSPLLAGIGGRYFEDCNEASIVSQRPSDFGGGVAPYALNPDNAARLWAKHKLSFLRYECSLNPEDGAAMQQTVERASMYAKNLDHEHRLLMPDGSIKHVHVLAQPFNDQCGNVEVVGTLMDVTDSKAFEDIKALKDELYKENIVLRAEVDKTSMFEEVVGTSPVLQAVLAHAAKVAPTESTVLITGETGTGKELIARAIHKRSQRSTRAFVSVNCAALPQSLITSALFGHEKGAFTGATQRRPGRFELAEGGTLFLDEIGELPVETQIALLRVLQEREFERVGGTEPLRADVRVIAATNRDLQGAITAGTFRSDLFYRLNVFPIALPALRERKEDIPPLVSYFVDRYAKRAGRKIRGIRKSALDLLESYSWPGNIRELQNIIERSLIVYETDQFTIDKSWLSGGPMPTRSGDQMSIETSAPGERDLIEAALAQTKGKVSGLSGAAAKLCIPASTLESKIRSLKINKYRFKER